MSLPRGGYLAEHVGVGFGVGVFVGFGSGVGVLVGVFVGVGVLVGFAAGLVMACALWAGLAAVVDLAAGVDLAEVADLAGATNAIAVLVGLVDFDADGFAEVVALDAPDCKITANIRSAVPAIANLRGLGFIFKNPL